MGIRIIVLIAVALAMLTVAVLTWGSIGSAVMIFGIITLVSALLYQRFLTNRDEDQFQEE